MKSRFLLSFLALTATLTSPCLALTPATEDFETKFLDSFKWFQFKPTQGKLRLANGKLNYVAKLAPTPNDFASIELLYNQVSIFENWEMIADFRNTAKKSKHAGCGFMIFNAADRRDYIYMNFFSSYGISTGFFNNLNHKAVPRLSKVAIQPIGAVRVVFDSILGIMTFYSSSTVKEEGYAWQEIGTFSPNAGGIATAVGNWGMTETSSLNSGFGFQLFGKSEGSLVGSGQVTIDNFSLQPIMLP